jgi:hypothetical protein
MTKTVSEKKESIIDAIIDDHLRPNTYVSKHIIWKRMRLALFKMNHESLNDLWTLMTCVRTKKTKKSLRKVTHVFKVQQSPSSLVYLNFPLDMLRRDSCYPLTSEDAANIAFSFNLKRSKGHVGEISLCREAPKNWKPNKDRWVSFGWEVVSRGFLD